jgi:DHA1 family tetracycline resistance protein-like MFS transporter
MTRRVEPWEQGQLQGANSAMMGITAIIGPSLYLLPFAWAIRHDATLHLPGLPILIAAAMVLAAAVLTLRVARPLAAEPQAA